MTSWILTFVVVSVVNGNLVQHQHTAMDMRGPDHCATVLRSVQQNLPRTARIVRPQCQEVWRT